MIRRPIAQADRPIMVDLIGFLGKENRLIDPQVLQTIPTIQALLWLSSKVSSSEYAARLPA
jgi:hypothetical protein